MSVEIDATVGPNGHMTIETPDAIIIITQFEAIGTQVAIYDDGDSNPVAYVHVREQKDASPDQGNSGQRSSVVTPIRRRSEGGSPEVG